MSEMIPNHICKNENCHKGKDGGKKTYYACNYCGRTENWRSIACTFDCYQEYMMQVIEARTNNNKVDILPDRLDMTKTEIKEMMSKPVEVVLKETKKQLKDYVDEDESTDFAQVVDRINADIDNTKRAVTRDGKKKMSAE